MKLHRSGMMKNLPLLDGQGDECQFCLPDPAPEILRSIDMDAGGTILSNQIIPDNYKLDENVQSYMRRKSSEQGELILKLGKMKLFNHRQREVLLHALKKPGAEYTVKSHMLRQQITHQTSRTDLAELVQRELFTSHKIEKLTPILWKQHFADNPPALRSGSPNKKSITPLRDRLPHEQENKSYYVEHCHIFFASTKFGGNLLSSFDKSAIKREPTSAKSTSQQVI